MYLQAWQCNSHDLESNLEDREHMQSLQACLKNQIAWKSWSFVFRDLSNWPTACLQKAKEIKTKKTRTAKIEI